MCTNELKVFIIHLINDNHLLYNPEPISADAFDQLYDLPVDRLLELYAFIVHGVIIVY